jgi:hypothetical protein
VKDFAREKKFLISQRKMGPEQPKIQLSFYREFPNVVVFWPHSVTGSPEHLCRLLYNAITRAQNHCNVIVPGQGG